MSKAIVLKVDASWCDYEVTGLESMQAAVGGYVELLELPGGTLLWLDEEGKLKGRDVNVVATNITRNIGLMPGDLIVGDVLLTGPLTDDGEGYVDIDDELYATLPTDRKVD